MKKKTCKQCLIEKKLDAFYVDANMSEGVRNSCKECEKSRMAKYWHENKHRLRGGQWHGDVHGCEALSLLLKRT
jgi:hypothetical protein